VVLEIHTWWDYATTGGENPGAIAECELFGFCNSRNRGLDLMARIWFTHPSVFNNYHGTYLR